MSFPLVEITSVVKDYGGPQPLRVDVLRLDRGERFTLAGFDAGAAEMLIHLITGAALPDDGDVRIAGTSTRGIATDTAWLSSLDRFGLVTERAVLIEKLTLADNLALPLTLSIDPIPESIRPQIEQLATDVGLPRDRLTAPRRDAHAGRARAAAPGARRRDESRRAALRAFDAGARRGRVRLARRDAPAGRRRARAGVDRVHRRRAVCTRGGREEAAARRRRRGS